MLSKDAAQSLSLKSAEKEFMSKILIHRVKISLVPKFPGLNAPSLMV
jgi:hypothetical protein